MAHYGVRADGSSDDSAAIQKAIDKANAQGGGAVVIPRGNFACNVTLREGVALVGAGGRNVNAGEGSTLKAFTAANPVITLADDDFMQMRNLTVWAGNEHCIVRLAGTGSKTNFRVDNCTLQPGGTTGAGIYMEGDIEEVYISDVRVSGGGYGFYLANVAEGGGGISAFARSSFHDCFFTGQAQNGLRINCATRANSLTFQNIAISNSQQSAMLLSRLDDATFINLNIEGAAQAHGAAKWTTGSITSGTPTLVVASATGYAISDTATVAGAGTDGVDLSSVITNVVGTTITLTSNASTTVTDADVTRSTIDMIAVDSAPGGTMGYNMTFIGCGWDDANSPVRYTMNLGNTGGNCTFIDCNVGGDATSGKAPIYDPLGYATIIGGTCLYRQAGVANDQFRNSTFSNANTPGGNRGRGQRTQIMSAQGGALVMGLRDSGDDGTGTYGEFEIRKRTAARDRIFRVDANGGMYLVDGITAVASGAGFISQYIDTADGDFKMVFGDGTRKTISVDATGAGTFTCDADALTTVSDSRVSSASQVTVTPTNAAAGLLLRSNTCYVDTITTGAFNFNVSASAAGAPAGTETFNYTIFPA